MGWGHSTAVCVVVQRMPRSMYGLVHCEQPRIIVERAEDVGHLTRDTFIRTEMLSRNASTHTLETAALNMKATTGTPTWWPRWLS